MKSPDGNDYTGVRGSRFHLFPASALFKTKPKWVMAAELVETTRLYARDVAVIQPEWIEQGSVAPRPLPLFRAALGTKTRRSRRQRTRDALRPDRIAAPPRVLRQSWPEEAREIFIRGALVAQESNLQTAFCPQ